MSTIHGLTRRIDTLQSDLEHIPNPQERGILLLPCKDGIDGIGESSKSEMIETPYNRTIFYQPGATTSEIERLIHG